MSSARQVLPGFLIGAVSVMIILGSFMVSFAEGTPPITKSATQESATATLLGQAINPVTKTPLVLTPTRTLPTSTPLPSATLTITPTACPKPAGWVLYLVKTGDTPEGLAGRFQTSVESLLALNCLSLDGFTAGISIYVPPLPTKTSIPCGAPSDWVLYPVQPGDTLYRLSLAFGVTVPQLQKANCMGSSTLLVVGKWIYVPPWAPILPTATEDPIYTLFPTWTVIVPDPLIEIPTEIPGMP